MSGPACTQAGYLKVMALTDQGASLAEIVAATGVSKRTIARMRNGEWEPPRGPSMPLLGRSPLTGVIEEHMDSGWTLDDLTVLARDNDPFRQDTDEGHKLGRWLRDTLEAMGIEVGEGGRKFHNRGLHYMLIGQVKPDGSVYRNTERSGSGCATGRARRPGGSGTSRSPRSPTSATPSRILALAAIWICPLAKRNCRRRPTRLRNVTACGAVPLLIRRSGRPAPHGFSPRGLRRLAVLRRPWATPVDVHPVAQGPRVDPQVPGHLRGRLLGLPDQSDRQSGSAHLGAARIVRS